jgi:hypothetical protein
MLGLILNDENVAWADDRGVIHRGIVVALTDDELWAEVREMGQDNIVQLPTWSLYVVEDDLTKK